MLYNYHMRVCFFHIVAPNQIDTIAVIFQCVVQVQCGATYFVRLVNKYCDLYFSAGNTEKILEVHRRDTDSPWCHALLQAGYKDTRCCRETKLKFQRWSMHLAEHRFALFLKIL